MPIAESLLFLREWLRDPRKVAAVAPSGRSVAALITQEISAATGPVIELGPGTGAFTQALIDRGVRQQDLTLIEVGASFARLLRARFPQARVLCMDAATIDDHALFAGARVGAVISGLGFRNMSRQQIADILAGAFRYLRPDGAFFLFTYGPRCPVAGVTLDDLGLEATAIGKTFRNIPPAAVYRLTRRQDQMA
jgi:phospholipid N-methyltransferase